MNHIGVKKEGRAHSALAACAAVLLFFLCTHAQADLTMTGGTYMLADSSIVQGGGIVTNSVYLASGTVAAPPGAGRIESMSPALLVELPDIFPPNKMVESAILSGRLFRQGLPSGGDFDKPNVLFELELDFHFQVEKLGTLNEIPDL